MSDLTDFLLARIAEDEAVAKVWRDNDAVVAMQADFDPDVYEREPWARVLAECEAKRRIVEECGDVEWGTPAKRLARGVLEEMATPFADHPDYREEWRP